MTVRSAALPFSLPLRTPRQRRRLVKAVAVVVLALVVLGGGWMWLRDSPLVSVDHVHVTGAHGPGAAHIREVLDNAASDMTTLHVNESTLRTAVAPLAAVRSIDIHAHPPHTLTIVVHMNTPVAAVVYQGQPAAVGADGALLSGLSPGRIPAIHVATPPGGGRVTTPTVRAEIAVAAAAPEPLRRHVASIFRSPRGLSARLRNGPVLYFGSVTRLTAKWVAIARVLADSDSSGATYLDATVPERVAAGGLEPTTTLNQ